MKISIITVCYNSEKYIEDTIKSVLSQTYNNIEYIIVDGNSTDGTINIIRKYESQFKGRLTWVSESDKGIYDAMNKGIKMASGDVIGILNSDDYYYDSDVLSKVMKLFITSGSDAVYGDLLYVTPQNLAKVVRYWKSGEYKEGLFKWGWMPPHPSLFVNKIIYQKFGFFDLDFKSAADYEFMLRVIHKNKISISYYPQVLVKMRAGGQSNVSVKNRIRGNREDSKAWKKNNLKPYFFTLYLKPLRKLLQYIYKP